MEGYQWRLIASSMRRAMMMMSFKWKMFVRGFDNSKKFRHRMTIFLQRSSSGQNKLLVKASQQQLNHVEEAKNVYIFREIRFMYNGGGHCIPMHYDLLRFIVLPHLLLLS